MSLNKALAKALGFYRLKRGIISDYFKKGNVSDFETFILAKGIPISEVTTPLERLLLRLGLISKPVGMFSYPIRALWFSITFCGLFLGVIELTLRLLFEISFFTSLPPTVIFLSIIILLSFGPVAAYFSVRAMQRHRDVLKFFSTSR